MYLTIVDGQIKVDRTTDFRSLDALQAFVGGYIEGITVPSPCGRELFAYINEEGKLLGLPPNFYSLEMRDVIVGPCVICGTEMKYDEEGYPEGKDNAPLTQEEVERLVLVQRAGHSLPVLMAKEAPANPHFGVGRVPRR
jgi:hypothetical protein